MNKHITSVNDHTHEFYQNNISEIEMIYPIEYYKNKITVYEDNYYGFNDISMEITQLMNISSIIEVNNFVPNLLTFLVTWLNKKGYIYYLYTFDENNNIIKHYLYKYSNYLTIASE